MDTQAAVTEFCQLWGTANTPPSPGGIKRQSCLSAARRNPLCRHSHTGSTPSLQGLHLCCKGWSIYLQQGYFVNRVHRLDFCGPAEGVPIVLDLDVCAFYFFQQKVLTADFNSLNSRAAGDGLFSILMGINAPQQVTLHHRVLNFHCIILLNNMHLCKLHLFLISLRCSWKCKIDV